MNEELEKMRFAHIRITIQSDYPCNRVKIHFNEPETMLFTTMVDDEIKSIFLEDETYHKLVIRKLEQFIEMYKIKYL